MINGEMAALRPVLEAMPRERVDACPELSLAFGATMLAFGKQELAEPHLRGAAGAVDRVPPERQAQFAAASAAVGLYEGRFGGDPAAALLGRAGMARARPGARRRRGGAQPAWPAPTQLGIVEMWTGELDEAIEHLERAQAVAAEAGVEWTAFASSAHLGLASVLRGDLARALRRAHQALDIAERRGWARSEPAGRRLLRARRRLPPARSAATRPNASSARPARRCATHASGRSCRPRPQSRAAVERPRRARRRTRPPARDARAARRLAAAGGGRRAPDRPGRRSWRRRPGSPRPARALLARRDRGARWPSPTRWPGWICWTARRRRPARRSPRTWMTWTRATGRPCRYAPRPGCSTRWPWTRSPSTRPPRSRWNARSTWPSRQALRRIVRGARRRDRAAPAPPRPPRHRPSRDGRRPRGDDRAPRPPGPAPGRPAPGRAAERTRAGDPRLPAEHDVQPGDRRRADDLGQHRQDASQGDLPQARRAGPPRGGPARPRARPHQRPEPPRRDLTAVGRRGRAAPPAASPPRPG